MKVHQPESVAAAVGELAAANGDAKIVAGGTALVLMMQQRLIAPEVLVSLGRIPDFDGIEVDASGATIGAGATLTEIARHEGIRTQYPSLAEACGRVGNVRIRNAATIGGNLAEADYASDPPAVLVALDATVHIAGPGGERTSPVADLLLGFYTTSLEEAEIITAVTLPPRDPARDRDVYLKYVSRSSEDRPCVGVAVNARFEPDGSGAVESLRIAVGAAAGTPQRLPEVDALATGQRLTPELADQIAGEYASQITPMDDLRGSAWYRSQMIRHFTRQALAMVSSPETGRTVR